MTFRPDMITLAQRMEIINLIADDAIENQTQEEDLFTTVPVLVEEEKDQPVQMMEMNASPE